MGDSLALEGVAMNFACAHPCSQFSQTLRESLHLSYTTVLFLEGPTERLW